MKLSIEVLDGSLAGQRFEFDQKEGEEVHIGRDPDCALVLPADYERVSRQHCALRVRLGQLRVAINKRSATFVNDRPARDESVVATGTELRLGEGGVRLRVVITAAGLMDARSTVFLGSPLVADPEAQTAETAARTASELVRQRRSLRGVAVLGLAVVGFGTWWAFEARADTERVLAATLTDAQRTALAGLLARSAQTVDMKEVVNATEPSVYCVMLRADGRERQVGTAWVFDAKNGLVATNAHVAEMFVAGGSFLRRATNAVVQDLAITAVRSHGGYEEFEQHYTNCVQALEGITSTDRAIGACDVALMVVAEADRAQLAPALRVAARDELTALSKGASCAFVGYPSEGLAFNPDKPRSHAHIGHLIGVSDYFLSPAASGLEQLLHTDLPVAGGASGSPVVNDRGHVIGIMSAGSFALSREGRRVPIGGVTYAQRIDTLLELHEGTADNPARSVSWTDTFTALVDNARKTIEEVMKAQFRSSLAKKGGAEAIENVARGAAELAWDGQSATYTFDFAAEQNGDHMICAMAEDAHDIDMVAILPSGETRVDAEPDWFPAVKFEAAAGESVRLVVFRKENAATKVSFFVLRSKS